MSSNERPADALTEECILAIDELRELGNSIGYALLDGTSVFDRAYCLVELTRVVRVLRANKALKKGTAPAPPPDPSERKSNKK